MNSKELFETALIELKRINPSIKVWKAFKKINDSFFHREIVGYYIQLVKDPSTSGLALEMFFFDKKTVIDIVASSEKVDYLSSFMRCVNAIYIEINDSQSKPVTLSIDIGEKKGIYYSADESRIEELITLKHKMLNLIN